MKWEYTTETVQPGESRYEVLRKRGEDGWEAWHLDRDTNGWVEIYFKRPLST